MTIEQFLGCAVSAVSVFEQTLTLMDDMAQFIGLPKSRLLTQHNKEIALKAFSGVVSSLKRALVLGCHAATCREGGPFITLTAPTCQ